MRIALIGAALLASMLSASAQANDCPSGDYFACAKQRVDQQYSVRKQGRSWYDSNGVTWTRMSRWTVIGSDGTTCTRIGRATHCHRR